MTLTKHKRFKFTLGTGNKESIITRNDGVEYKFTKSMGIAKLKEILYHKKITLYSMSLTIWAIEQWQLQK